MKNLWGGIHKGPGVASDRQWVGTCVARRMFALLPELAYRLIDEKEFLLAEAERLDSVILRADKEADRLSDELVNLRAKLDGLLCHVGLDPDDERDDAGDIAAIAERFDAVRTTHP